MSFVPSIAGLDHDRFRAAIERHTPEAREENRKRVLGALILQFFVAYAGYPSIAPILAASIVVIEAANTYLVS